ncbi:MAG: ATP-dependent helicase HrpB [Lentisphaeraceae bacterium]|nr:ATP-dependent helicase HrpB [Lentisphaeraceae bacterium]
MNLPVEKLRQQITETLAESKRLVFTSPPGSGKSTMLPRFLADDMDLKGKVVVLQPRRLAARSLAFSVAKMSQNQVGSYVGYQVRGESQESKETKVSYRTVGLLLRQMQSDPLLKDISAVVLDEFHERSWQSDLVLAFVKQLQKQRKDLLLVVMSATMEAKKSCDYLDGAPHLETDNRLYEIDFQYRHFDRKVALWDRVSDTISEHIQRTPNGGDILAFLPGQYEIKRTCENLQKLKGIATFALYGSLPPDKQDLALKKQDKRRVIVATNIAETSLTVEGVDTVVDAGFSRENIFDSTKGFDTLSLQSISVFSAEQRAGRAGRLGPGTAYRLWSKEEQSRKPINTVPQMMRVDSSEVLLAIQSMGHSKESFDWFEKPQDDELVRGEKLLIALGALEDNKITELGQLMSQFPAHPRLAAMLLNSAQNACYDEACRWAAIVSERNPVDKSVKLTDDSVYASDLRAICNIWAGLGKDTNRDKYAQRYKLHRGALRSLEQVYHQFKRLLKVEDNFIDDESRLVYSVLAAFPDKLARRVDRGSLRYRFGNDKVGELTRNSAVRSAEFIIPLNVTEINNGGSSKTLLSLAVEVDFTHLEAFFGEKVKTTRRVVWNEKTRTVEQQEQSLLGEFVLREKNLSETPDSLAAEELLVEKILQKELKLNQWNKDVDKWIQKVRWVSKFYPEKELLEYNADEQQIVLLEMCSGCRSYKDVKNLPVLDYFKNAMGWDEQQFVQSMTPEKIKLPSGRNMKLSYEEDGKVKGSGFIQDFYGMTETPTVAGGRVKVLLDMWAPNRRTVHLTDDLEGFWDGVYKDIRSQLKGRYPKHEWI